MVLPPTRIYSCFHSITRTPRINFLRTWKSLTTCLLDRKPLPHKTLVPSKQGGDFTLASYYLTQETGNKTVLTLGLKTCLLLLWGKHKGPLCFRVTLSIALFFFFLVTSAEVLLVVLSRYRLSHYHTSYCKLSPANITQVQITHL